MRMGKEYYIPFPVFKFGKREIFKPVTENTEYFRMSRQLKGKQYDHIALQNAVRAVMSKSMGYLKASKLYGVPRSTIYDKVVGKSDIGCFQGSPTLLSQEEETRLVNWLTDMSRIGYGRSKQELLDVVQKIIKSDGRSNRCKDDRPGKDWYYSFMGRHPEISLRSPRQLGKERAVIKPEHVEKWFGDFEAFIKDTVPDPYILLDPTRLYNADETGFSMCPKTGYVLGLKGAKSVYNITASDKSQITVMAGMSAAAHYLRPMIVFAGQRFTRNMLEGFDEAVLGRSENGWMDSELFVMWLKTVFIPDIEKRQVKKPVILFVDGHKTHMTMEASDVCKDNGVILYCLLEHASHLMQPCDLRLFSSLKEMWKSSLREWQIEHVGQYVTKFEFAAIFKKAWINASKVENAVNGFKDAGLFPLDKDKVLKTDKFQTSILFTPSVDKSNETQDDRENVQKETVSSSEERSDIETSQDHTNDEASQTARKRIEARDDGETKKEETIAPKSVTATQQEVTAENNLTHQPSTSGAASPLSKILNIPTLKPSKKRNFRREILPKAITGEEFRKLLNEKKRKREEEEAEKQKRKQEREQKRLRKEIERKVKAEQRLLKKKQKEEEKDKKPKMKRHIKKSSKSKVDDSDEEGSDFSVQDDSDDNMPIDPNKCYKCDGVDDDSGWIGCQKCFRFFHRKCTDIEFEFMSEEEILGFPFECLYC